MADTQSQTLWIDLSQIDIPSDAREHDPEKLKTLAQDMKEQGQLQEIVVVKIGDRFEVLAGAGRTQAARALGWEKIRASVRQGLSAFDKARITFAENEDREDADAFYQAAQMAKMIKAKDCSQQALADELGLSEALVNAYLGIDKLPSEVKKLKRLSLGQLIQICRLKNDKDRIDLSIHTKNRDLSVRQVKAIVDKLLGKEKSSKRSATIQEPKPADPLVDTWEKIQSKTKGWAWEAGYPAERTWEFRVILQGMQARDDKKTLGQWFLAMAEAMGETKLDHKTEKMIGVTNAVSDAYADILRKIQSGEMEKEIAKGKN
ncbi:MAG: hypothetical protein A2992_09355 [Elusimicrobia bacterium RIFCSPLOWO2_01_FULL_59_12]|nr:MAG: hypothetical protein A2992_09355 [Elusimicrobia bacterium RIFCSPLOWO2_01_FULL_59_12]